MILILTEAEDPHAAVVAQKLTERGADVVRFDPADFPAQSAISLRYAPSGLVRSTLRVGARELELHRVGAVWFRRPGDPVAHPEIGDPLSREFIEEESKLVARDVWDSMTCLAVPAPRPVIQRAQLKASQLKVAAELGFELPPTLITNDPAALIQFYNEHNGSIITKQAGLSSLRGRDVAVSRYTQPVTRRDIGYAHSIRYCPMIVQAYVPKQVELRVTVVGKQVFAAEIHSQETHHTRYDWRRYDVFKTPYFEHALPPGLQELCVRLVERLGLCYGALDLVLTPDGRYVFLEINPSGQYLWIEDATGLPISDAICDLLMAGVPGQGAPDPLPTSAWEA